MAPTDIQKQTYAVIHCLLRDLDMVEHDGPEDNNSFDPAKIASKLRELGDDYDEKVIRPLIKNMQRAAADQVVTVFTDSVDSMCKMWVVERAEVASEKQLFKAAITLGLYMKENCPDMTNAVEVAMTGFINNRLTNWIAEQGGWTPTATTFSATRSLLLRTALSEIKAHCLILQETQPFLWNFG